jgi:CheY-like chemotaxis protein
MGRQMLQRLGYQVTTRQCSREAFQYFCAHCDDIDLVITDQTMPLMSGLELAEAMQSSRTDIPILLCTGFSECVSKERVSAAGIRKYLIKPLTMRSLAVAVRDVLDNTAENSPTPSH